MANQSSASRAQDETDTLLARLIHAHEAMITTAQTDTPLFHLIETAILTMNARLLREAADWAAVQGL